VVKENILKVAYQFVESGIAAFWALRQNKMRSLLSTLGISIGIFCIITVLSLVDSLEKNLQNSIDSLGKDVAFVEKWPWTFSSDYKWWKFMNRPNPTISELKKVEEQVINSRGQMITIDLNNQTLKYRSNSAEGISGIAVSHGFKEVRNFELIDGRYFTENESNHGDFVTILGNEIAQNLFPGINPLNRETTINGLKYRIIGVFKKEGESLIGNSTDNTFIIPAKTAANFIRLTSNRVNSRLQIKAASGVKIELLEEELRGIMRSIRKLRPGQEDNFAINKTTLISEPLKETFRIVNLAGWIIGGFAMLVGGFGIANIMFVSVTERTAEIGIQKALGAKKYFILFEFLTEATVLCLVGGLVGLGLVWLTTTIVKSTFEINIFLSLGNIVTGIFVSVGIGIISGFIPAWKASKLDPVEAIRYK